MSTVYFPVSKYNSTNIYMKENSNTDCVVNVKSVAISNELGLQIYSNLFKILNLNLLQEDPKELKQSTFQC